MNIVELQLQLQLATPPEVREQRKIEIKVATKNIESKVQECLRFFEYTMEI